MKRIAVLLAAACVACGGSSTGVVHLTTAPIGTWTLQTINGANLPVVRGSGASAITIHSATLTVSSDGSYREVSSITLASGQASTSSELGTWTETNVAGVTFHDQSDNTVYEGSHTLANVLTTQPATGTKVYARQ